MLWCLYRDQSFSIGRHVYAIGGNERSAELSGVRINLTKVIVLVSAVLCGHGGADHCIAVGGGAIRHRHTFELNAIAAVVLGGTSLAGAGAALAERMIALL